MSKIEAGLITVAVVEDDTEMHRSLVGILKRGPGVICVGDYGNAEDALREIPLGRPKVALMDMNLPGMDGVHCVRKLSELSPETQVLMLTVFDNTDAIFNSLAAGASGYLLKPISAAQLLSAVHDVYAGGAPMTSDIARKVVQTFKQPAPTSSETENLTPREQEVIDFWPRVISTKKSPSNSPLVTGPFTPTWSGFSKSCTSAPGRKQWPNTSVLEAGCWQFLATSGRRDHCGFPVGEHPTWHRDKHSG